jgi:hypothetical protein
MWGNEARGIWGNGSSPREKEAKEARLKSGTNVARIFKQIPSKVPSLAPILGKALRVNTTL